MTMTEHALRPLRERPRSRVRQQGPSPWEAERVRPLTRCQVTDHFPELGALYAANSGTGPWEGSQLSRAFLWRLRLDMRRPGFSLLIAENAATTACAYGFPLSARLFAIREIVVRPRVRQQFPDRDWNLARRLQRRLLTDHGGVTGITVARRSDTRTLVALRSWGWRDVAAAPYGGPLCGPCRILLLDV
ncbi:hypothetical protein [Streptomyces spectabilis]|uniref:GNAT family N-acetyltransferase n=1 Tax=Streptomyces spectabilis TaxID=68270 RepID=A0A5P2X052_STRST|nr:hypothetical protein [Streptomyces spectabilis]MBB5107447.1 hypothetical protein [Streptomyces spectabilis]MCI3900135.1 hypothetical protein [Streptomyces spectabilis]QEV57748.1 hypothetical protein CP982_02680 [Streptomyces spectabilis]GGV37683.1 hypothetical protein GCM10010245_59990 [Streptomyces spectabilis]